MIVQKELKELLHYNPDTGLFTWLSSRGKTRTGDIAGTDHMYYRHGKPVPSGYQSIVRDDISGVLEFITKGKKSL